MLSNQEKYNKIVEWLYTNDDKFNSKNEWRSKFLIFLQETLVDSNDLLETIKKQFDKIEDNKNIDHCVEKSEIKGEIKMENGYDPFTFWPNYFNKILQK